MIYKITMYWNIFHTKTSKITPEPTHHPVKKKQVVFANYEKERKVLQALLELECQERIVLIRGEGGQGKSLLLGDFLSKQPRTCKIDFKIESYSIEYLFTLVCKGLIEDQQKLYKFNQTLYAILHPNSPNFDFNAPWLADRGNHLKKALSDRSAREQRRNKLIDSLVEDIKKNIKPEIFLIWFDTFEKADGEIIAWVNYFLRSVIDCPPVRIIIGGRDKLPDHDNLVWGDYCSYHELNGVPNPAEWMRIAETEGRKLSPEQKESIAETCTSQKGHCLSMMSFISRLDSEQT